MSKLNRIVQRMTWITLFLSSPLWLYVLIAHLGVLFTSEARLPAEAPSIQVAVLNNGIHTDIVLPIQHAQQDWRAIFALPPSDARWMAIGWGDREFYLNTPTWSDLTLSTALGAITGKNVSVVHVSLLTSADVEAMRWINLDRAQYRLLVDKITQSIDPEHVQRPFPGYTESDLFFQAHGSYSLTTTCNTWTADALEEAGVMVPRWAPFAWLVTYHSQHWP